MAERKEGFGRTALITGASSGIGLELSRLFAADGYDLVVVGRSVEKLKALVTQLESEHEVRVQACPMDLSQLQAAHALWSELTNAGVAVDVLVNNAGVGLYGELWEQDADELHRMLVLNVEVLTLLNSLCAARDGRTRLGSDSEPRFARRLSARGAPNGRLLRLKVIRPVVFERPGG